MRTILFLTQTKSGAALAKRIEQSGDRIIFEDKLFVSSLFDPEVFKRLVKQNPDLAIIDSNFEASPMVKVEFEKMGIPVYGASPISKSVLKHPDYIKKILNINMIRTDTAVKEAIPITYSVVLSDGKKISSCAFFEYKRLMNDDKGPIASMGSVGYFGDIKAIDARLDSLIKSFLNSGFSGKIDFQLRLAKDVWCDSVYFYFSWNTIYAFLENVQISPSDFFYKISLNQDLEIKFKSKWSCQINCGVPPFPYELEKDGVTEVLGVDPNNSKHLWFMNFKNGELLSVTGRGEYIREAKRRAYRTLSNISAKDLMYRTDIGQDTVDTCRRLNRSGWLDIAEDDLVEPFKNIEKQPTALPSVH